MSFRVEFADGDVIWLPYSKDLDETEAFGKYIASLPMLEHLSYGPKRQGVSHRITPGRYPRLCCGEHAVRRHPLLQLRLVRRRAHFPGRPLRQDLRCAIYEVAGVTPRVLKAYCPVYDEVWEATTGTTKLDAY